MFKLSSGGGGSKIVEHRLSVWEECEVSWDRQHVDRREVLKLFSQGWSINAISRHFNCGRGTISKVLLDVRRSQDH